MNKQKKQLLLLLLVLIIAIVAFLFVSKMPDEDETEEAVSYTVTDLEAENVSKLVFTNDTGTYTLTKQEDGTWTYEGDKTLDMDETAVESLISKVSALTSEDKIEQVEDVSGYGLDEPAITILVSDGINSYTLLVGDYNDVTYTYYICLENDVETVYTTTSYSISSFQNGIDSLVAEEEETTEEMSEETTQTQE